LIRMETSSGNDIKMEEAPADKGDLNE